MGQLRGCQGVPLIRDGAHQGTASPRKKGPHGAAAGGLPVTAQGCPVWEHSLPRRLHSCRENG